MPDYQLSKDAYKAFVTWAKEYYRNVGMAIPANKTDILTHPAYLAWKNFGYPEFAGAVERAPAAETPSWATKFPYTVTGGETSPTGWLPKQVSLTQLTPVPTTPTATVPEGWRIATEEEIKRWGLKAGGNYLVPITPAETPDEATARGLTQADLENQRLQNELLRKQLEEYGKPTEWQTRLATERVGQETMRMQEMLHPTTGLSTQEQANIYEQARKDILSTATGPADWITRWTAQNAQNPYVAKQQSEIEQLATAADKARAEQGHWQALAESNATGWQMTPGGLMPKGGEPIYSSTYIGEGGIAGYAAQAAQYAGEQATKWEAEAEALSKFDEPAPEPARPTTPPAPFWLPAFASQQVAGKPITKQQIPTPSGQLLTSSPWSVLQGVSGYANYAGGRTWQDILDEAAMMQPATPIGAGRTSWSPARSRISR